MVPSTIPAAVLRPAPAQATSAYTLGPELDARFEQFVRYKHGYKHVSAATVKWYRETFRIFLRFLASRGVAAIDATISHHIIDWIAELSGRTKPLSPFTLQSYVQAVHIFFSHLEAFDGFPNPFRLLDFPKVDVDPEPKALDVPECERVLDAAENTMWADEFERARATAMLATALYAGLRRGEILRLKVVQVNLDEGWILVVNGKGNKTRATFIAPELEAILRRYLDARRRAGLESVEFFTSRKGGKGVKVKTLARIVDRVRKTAGFRFSLHMLRHSFVTELARNHEAPHTIRQLAGHRDLKTTQRYTRIFADDMRRAVGRLSFRSAGVPTARRRAEGAAPQSQTPAQTHGSTVSASSDSDAPGVPC